MSRLKDLTGQRFGRLTVIERAESRRLGKQLKTFWLCRCDCGNMKEVSATNLQTGCSRSCGCIANESRIFTGITTESTAVSAHDYTEFTGVYGNGVMTQTIRILPITATEA